MPNTYVTPRARDAQQSAGGYASDLARAPSMAMAKTRKEESAQKRAAEAMPQTSTPASPPRDPAEWIKAILKLRAEGRHEQVLKELAEFRKQHPAYPLPDELKPLAAVAK